MKFRMNQKVKILKNLKVDGRCNIGKVIGIEKTTTSQFGYFDEKQFWKDIEEGPVKYKVAYIDCVTKRFCQEWYWENSLSNLK